MQDFMKSIAPLLLLVGLGLTLTGVGLASCFAYVIYHIIYTPQDVPLLAFVIQHLPAADVPGITISGLARNDGQPVTIALSPDLKMFGFVFLLCIGAGLVVNTTRAVTEIGLQIIKALFQMGGADQKDTPAV